jgi:hypothetical protein
MERSAKKSYFYVDFLRYLSASPILTKKKMKESLILTYV